MKRILICLSLSSLILSSCENFGYGKYGRCQAYTKSGNRCKNNAGKTGYCGAHNN